MLKAGTMGKHEIVVTEELLASHIGSGLVHVYATPMMIAGMESCAAGSVADQLDKAQTTVGTRIEITHEAATPLGMRVRFETELTDVSANGRLLTFRVAAYDEIGLIGQGTHQRAVVWRERFEQKALEKTK